MFNPFSLFTPALLDAFVKAGKVYYVRQTFKRGIAPGLPLKGCFQISHYSDLPTAEAHYNAIAKDGYRYLYRWESKEDQTKLLTAAGQPSGYRIYANVLEKDWESYISKPLRLKIKNYIENRLGWVPSGNETVAFSIFSQFGEIYAHLKLRNREAKVRLLDIEES